MKQRLRTDIEVTLRWHKEEYKGFISHYAYPAAYGQIICVGKVTDPDTQQVRYAIHEEYRGKKARQVVKDTLFETKEFVAKYLLALSVDEDVDIKDI